jgi:hypothetical protein
MQCSTRSLVKDKVVKFRFKQKYHINHENLHHKQKISVMPYTKRAYVAVLDRLQVVLAFRLANCSCYELRRNHPWLLRVV